MGSCCRVGRADERGNIVADHLRDDGLPGGVPLDGVENPLLRRRLGVDAEVLGPVDVGTAVLVNQRPEGAVGDVLHRRQGQQRHRAVQAHGELFVWLHRDRRGDWDGWPAKAAGSSMPTSHALAGVFVEWREGITALGPFDQGKSPGTMPFEERHTR